MAKKSEDDPTIMRRSGTAENAMRGRILAALAHPDCPEFIDTLTSMEKDALARHIAIRLTIERSR